MKKNIPVFVTHYGCPNQCVFCNQKKISGYSRQMDFSECEQLLEAAASKGYAPNDTEVAFFGGSFTGIPRAEQKRYLEIAQQYRSSFGGIRLSTRPDYISHSQLAFLKEYGVTTIELGVQSMVDQVLIANKRGMTAEDTKNAVSLIRQYDFSLGLQMMTGMYQSSLEDDWKTAEEIIRLRPDFVRIYPTVVLEDTELYELYKAGEYTFRSLNETVSHVAEIAEKFLQNKIPVIRIGLMASEEISPDKVIGAYHEAFGEMVQGEIYFKRIVFSLKDKETKDKILTIHCPSRFVSWVVGHNKRNINRLTKLYSLKKIKVIGNFMDNSDPFFFQVELQ